MPRAARKQPQVQFSAPESATALAVHRSPAAERLSAARKEHERLLREIAKKKAACEVSAQAARDAASALDQRVHPLREAFQSTLRQLREIFGALLGDDSRLNRRDKARVRRLYLELLPDLAAEGDADEPGAGPHDQDFAGHGSRPFGAEDWRGAGDAEAGYSATKPSEKNASLLRALFRKIAVALHPDKEQDPAQREALTSVMKEVTRAYEMGDVARLVEIERTWLASAPLPEQHDEVVQRLTQLLQANKELRRQLRSLSAELKDLKSSVPGADAPKKRGAKTQGGASSQVEQFVQEIERELAQIQNLRDFAQSFLDDEVSLAEFLMGPPRVVHGDEADPLDQLLEDMLEAMAAERRGGRARGARGKRPRRA
jgi:ABC-type transporter Mla subunit MlaD